MIAEDLTNRRFGMLTVKKLVGKIKYDKRWLCKCSCGKLIVVSASNLRTGNTKSCGCLKKNFGRSKHHKHGHCFGKRPTAEYRCWQSIKRRTVDPSHKDYPEYGGRGITVCREWFNSFENFYLDMGRKPSVHHSIERIDNNGNYESSNCKWATASEQACNTRRNRLVTFKGKTQPVACWAREIGVPYNWIYLRIRRGMPIERSMSSRRLNRYDKR